MKKVIFVFMLIGGMMAGCTRVEGPEELIVDSENAGKIHSDEGNGSVEDKKSLLDYGISTAMDTGMDGLDSGNRALEEAYEDEMAEIDALLEDVLRVSSEADEANETPSPEAEETYESYQTVDKTIEMLRKLDMERSNAAEIPGETGIAPGLTYGSDTYADSETLGMQEAYEEQQNEIDALWQETLVAMEEDNAAANGATDRLSTLTYGNHDEGETPLEEDEVYRDQESKVDALWKDTLASIHEEENATEEDVAELRGTARYIENPYVIVDGKGQGTRRTRGPHRRIIDTFWKDGEIAWQRGYYATGEVWYEQTYLDDKINGIRKEYDMKGDLIAEISYVAGKRHGSEKKYDDEGYIEETLWENNRIMSKKGYYPSGALHSVTPYLNDKKNGIYKEYSEKGEVVKEIPYLNDKHHGEEIQYYREGKYEGCRNVKKWEEGVVTSYRGYYPSGKLWFYIPYVEGECKGIGRYYSEEGKILSEFYYTTKGIFSGIQKTYHSNGNTKYELLWEKGSMVRKKKYYPSGRLKWVVPYDDKKRSGIMKIYDEEGKLIEEQSYKDDKRHGIQKVYKKDNTVNVIFWENDQIVTEGEKGSEDINVFLADEDTISVSRVVKNTGIITILLLTGSILLVAGGIFMFRDIRKKGR